MSKTEQKDDFRGLTIFELLIILAVVLGSFLWAFSARNNLRNQRIDTERKGRVSTLKEHLRSYVIQNGSFPSDSQFQDKDTRDSIFSTFVADQGKEALYDPKKTSQLISYSAEPEGCTATTEDPCTKVSVALELSNGDEYIKFAVKPGEELKYLQEATSSGDSTTENILKASQNSQNSGD